MSFYFNRLGYGLMGLGLSLGVGGILAVPPLTWWFMAYPVLLIIGGIFVLVNEGE